MSNPSSGSDDDMKKNMAEMLARIFSEGRFGFRHLEHGERGVVLSAVAAIDRALKDLLLARLAKDRWSEQMLFGATSPLGSVGPKAHLAFLMGLISKELRTDLLTLAKIRNRFAHDEEAKTFKDEIVAKEVEKLTSFDVKKAIDGLNAWTIDPELLKQYREQLIGGFAFEWNVRTIMGVLQKAAEP
jgi:DNA-binding MltR family transcriptional regulator